MDQHCNEKEKNIYIVGAITTIMEITQRETE